MGFDLNKKYGTLKPTGKLEIRKTGKNQRSTKFYEIVCSNCNNTKFMRVDKIRNAKSCGCVVYVTNKSFVKENEKYGKWLTTGKQETRNCGNVYVEVVNKNGDVSWKQYSKLKNPKGHQPMYKSWCSMKERCDNPNHHAYYRYGGRGIIYDKRWKTFKNFRKDMYPNHKVGLQLDRVNNDGDYSKDNCKWVTLKENQQHKSTTYEMYVGGKLVSLAEFCRHHGLNYKTAGNKVRENKVTMQELQ
jgi:hypothetical protein